MTFVDTNVFIYAVGRPHALQGLAREFFIQANRDGTPLCTSAEVVQELLHAYLPSGRIQVLEAAVSLLLGSGVEIWSLEYEDVALAWQLRDQHPTLSARDLCHLASCRRRSVGSLMTFDQALGSAFGRWRKGV